VLTLIHPDVVGAFTGFTEDTSALTEVLEREACCLVNYRDPSDKVVSVNESVLRNAAERAGAASGVTLNICFFTHGHQCASGELRCDWRQRSELFTLTHSLGSATVREDQSVETTVTTHEHSIRCSLADGQLWLMKVVRTHTMLYGDDLYWATEENKTEQTVHTKNVTVESIQEFFAEMLAMVRQHVPQH
jgi:hypothetical protein